MTTHEPRRRGRRAFPILEVLDALEREAPGWDAPVVAFMARSGAQPFMVLVACLLSLRTRDEVTAQVIPGLFRRARSPRGLLRLDEAMLIELIRPVGFYRTKARTLRDLSQRLLDEHGGQVPRTRDALLALPGVGPKTADLVLGEAFGEPAICVDIHVHRIPNRWGLIDTRTPEASGAALRAVVPRAHWLRVNPLVVAFGQTVCRPVSPWCSRCPVSAACARVGVTRSR